MTIEEKQADIAARIAAVRALGYSRCPRCGFPYERTRFYRPYFICRTCGYRWSENPITEAWGKFLEDLHTYGYPWDWFVTLTFAKATIKPAGAQHLFKRYLREMGEESQRLPYAFRADEYGPRGGRLHIHALIGNVAKLNFYCGQNLPPNSWGKRCCYMHRWFCGYARIFEYDPAKGARFYLSKYVTKHLAEYELIGIEGVTLKLPFREDNGSRNGNVA